jgi:hypothetical protein
MKDHITQWLGAYLDGELRGLRLRWVESHLKECAVCRSELETVSRLRALLQESPAVESSTPPERFVAQVGMRLPRRQEQPPARRALEWGWRLVPVGLLFLLAFVQSVFTIGGVVQIALRLGLGGDLGGYVLAAPTGGPSIPDLSGFSQSSVSGAVGIIEGLLRSGGGIALLPIVYVCVLAVIGLLYWSWLASWWVRQRHGQTPAPEQVRQGLTGD